MKILTIATAGITGLLLAIPLGAAQAANLPLKAPPSYVAPVSNWTGFYLGINGGLGAGKYDYSAAIDGLTATGSLNSSGGFGGGQIGYNYQFAPTWVGGIEADIEDSGIEGNLSINVPGFGSLSAGTKLKYFGTVRARVGHLITPSALLYVTGGWAYGENTSSLNINVPIIPFSHSSSDTHTKSGWTAGAGLEYLLFPHVSIKAEYLYLDLGEDLIVSGTILDVPASISEKTTVHTLKVGVNYRFY